jgi:hypothetical protein
MSYEISILKQLVTASVLFLLEPHNLAGARLNILCRIFWLARSNAILLIRYIRFTNMLNLFDSALPMI